MLCSHPAQVGNPNSFTRCQPSRSISRRNLARLMSNNRCEVYAQCSQNFDLDDLQGCAQW